MRPPQLDTLLLDFGAKRIRCGWIAETMLLGALLLLAGCQSWDPQGEEFKGPMAEFGSGLRKEADGGPGLGLSAKSRAIERNLGYK